MRGNDFMFPNCPSLLNQTHGRGWDPGPLPPSACIMFYKDKKSLSSWMGSWLLGGHTRGGLGGRDPATQGARCAVVSSIEMPVRTSPLREGLASGMMDEVSSGPILCT